MPKTTQLEICILAGGLSQRMGQDKSRLRLGQGTMLGMIQKVAKATEIKTRVIQRDLIPRCGPIGGIFSGLKTTKADAVIFLACDMPFITPAIIQRLAEFAATHPGHAAFLQCSRPFTLPLLVPCSALPAVASQIQNQRFSLKALAARMRAKAIRCSSDWAACFTNINTPSEFESARRLLLDLHAAGGSH